MTMMRATAAMAVSAFAISLSGCGSTGSETAASQPSTSQIFVRYSTVYIPAANQAPTANAGTNSSVNIWDTVILDGRSSSDPDGDILSYRWEIAARPTGSFSTITYSLSPTPSFTPDVPGTYLIQLTVHDGRAYSNPATVTITAADTPAIATDPSGNVSVKTASSTELFRDASDVSFAINVSVANQEPQRVNLSLVFEAKDAAGIVLFTSPVPLDMGLDPLKVTSSRISSFKLPIAKYDSISSWGIASIVRY
jgi:hypothetical protein